MPKPKPVVLTLKQELERMQKAGILRAPTQPQNPTQTNPNGEPADEDLPPLPNRIKTILGIVRHKPQKATTMNYLIMYDIENNKVRTAVSKYLEKQGCVRIQKSVFMANTDQQKFADIHHTLKDINSYYENSDSIIVVPVNVADVRSMKLIGNNVNIDVLVDPPNTLFF
ncbi:MAG: CRISPR-associated endonuclease Cas2 [Bacteroidetes bacterium]|nr:MAG: CRISPR-associated endonuclease Cas2 [Bacteroidota bacterium]